MSAVPSPSADADRASTSGHSSTADSTPAGLHRCRWLDCTDSFAEAELLYEHLTATHIGRKSAGTLSLECHWGECKAKATKRDHLTSHARVHVDLKPHACAICTKSFKRPQDLKKHEKIHSEEHHQHHKQSKALTVSKDGIITPTSKTPVPRNSSAKQSLRPDGGPTLPLPHSHGQASHAGAYPHFPPPYDNNYPFPYGFPPPPQHQHQHHHQQQQQQHPGGGMTAQQSLELAQLITQQQLLNAQAAASIGNHGPFPPQGYPGYPVPSYGQPQYNPNVYGDAPPGMIRLPGLPGHPPMYTHAPTPPYYLPTRNPSLAHSAPPPPPPATQSLYPQLPAPVVFDQNYSPAVKLESDHPLAPGSTPAEWARSPTYSSNGHSPKVPSLSPSGDNYSPSPEVEPPMFRRLAGNNSVAGAKRGFEEAAGEFLGDLKNKRFQDSESVASQLDALSSFLDSNDRTFEPSLLRARSTDGYSSQSSDGKSDYSRAEVDNINELLLSLGQTMAPIPTSEPVPSFPQPHRHNHHLQQSATMNVYPALPAMSMDRPLFSYSDHYPVSSTIDNTAGLASIRLSKSPAAPSIAANESREAQLRHVERLTRAPPAVAAAALALIQMDNVKGASDEEASARSARYSSSIRSTSSDEPVPALRSRGPQLPPMNPSYFSHSTTTLPPIKSLMELSRGADASSSSSSSSTTATRTSTSSSPSPSTTSVDPPQPRRQGSGMDTLAQRVYHLGIKRASSVENYGSRPSTADDEMVREEFADASDEEMKSFSARGVVVVKAEEGDNNLLDGEEEDDHEGGDEVDQLAEETDDDDEDTEAENSTSRPPKKTRFASPEPMATGSIEKDVESKRIRVIKMLVQFVNESYRNKLLRNNLARESAVPSGIHARMEGVVA